MLSVAPSRHRSAVVPEVDHDPGSGSGEHAPHRGFDASPPGVGSSSLAERGDGSYVRLADYLRP